MTTCRVGHLTFNPRVTFYVLNWLCRPAGGGKHIFVRFTTVALSVHGVVSIPTAQLVFLLETCHVLYVKCVQSPLIVNLNES